MSAGDINGRFMVVVLYDHVISAGRAMAAYSHLRRELESEFVPELRLWRIDVATSPECAAQVDGDIEVSAMLIIAVRGDQPCPAELRRWTDAPFERGGPRPGAVIAIVEAGDEPAQSAGTWSSVLRSAAAQTHLNVFFWAAPAPADRGVNASPWPDDGPDAA